MTDNAYDIIIIGGGPAGWTAGIYCGRARLKTLLLETFSVPGQLIMTDLIENFPGFPEGIGGFDLVEKIKAQGLKFDVKTDSAEIKTLIQKEHGWMLTDGISNYEARAVIIASGASPQKLNVPGEEKFTSRGVSYCAVCDGALYKGKDIVVIGGGDTAVQEALFLTKFGRKVYLVHRRDKLRATRILQERILADGRIEVAWDSVVSEIRGDQKVNAIRVKNVKTSHEKDIAVEGVFVCIGYNPNTSFARGILECDERGYLLADENMKTSRDGVFACGDCRKKPLRQIVTACSDGAVAAFSAEQYLENKA